MSRQAVEALMDRWVSDADFRSALRTDPDSAIAGSGIQLDADELAAIKNVDWSLSDDELQARISKNDCSDYACA